ncbi:Uncharacterised protein [Mycobacteroides abscessus]|nr:Uncharacterised protein [Mycobacteroides abscessus]
MLTVMTRKISFQILELNTVLMILSLIVKVGFILLISVVILLISKVAFIMYRQILNQLHQSYKILQLLTV